MPDTLITPGSHLDDTQKAARRQVDPRLPAGQPEQL